MRIYVVFIEGELPVDYPPFITFPLPNNVHSLVSYPCTLDPELAAVMKLKGHRVDGYTIDELIYIMDRRQ